MAVPAKPGYSTGYYEEIRDLLQDLVDDGVITAGGTVTTALSNLATERDDL